MPPLSLQDSLLHWFATNGRDLPWRRTYLPYHIWISEIMLQQTQMDRVVVYFTRWLHHYPDIASLADAREQEVLRLWEGLGYYSRARNIIKTADLLCRRHGGALPEDHASLLQLPGIGRYTAGAIMSLAFNRSHPIVDANVERLFSRLFNLAAPIKEKQTHSFIWQKAAELIPEGKARFFNQALMELGALLCLPRAPRCDSCPLRDHCEALAQDVVNERPVAGKAKEIIPITMVSGILHHQGKIYIQKRLPDDVWPNLWEFPGGSIEKNETEEQALVREYCEETGFAIRDLEKIITIKHSFTKYRVTLHCYHCCLQNGETQPTLHAAQEYLWVNPEELEHFAFPSPHRRLINHLAGKP
ncbi:MAG: A/G-specific adenine glycosylase [Desulfurivibrio sp.]|nr:A/G-specific adenine glycosylase [Desulfurivibrio sp.]MBU4118908.1 A/G-specific adenine glycosylase [Pseudomonadota bacterium]